MTSSLVGSEMCIRDRRTDNPATPVTLTGVHSAIATKTAHLASLMMWPVSYTHLTLPTICSV
eukprot:2690824-Prorocentrum_lima.AAC.1